MNRDKQPIPKKGFEFYGWTVFNWGICLDIVFRTRKDAKEWILKNRRGAHQKEFTWEEAKQNHKIVKVKCQVQ